MNFQIYKDAFRRGWGQKHIAAIVYVFQLCLAGTLGMQTYDVLQASIGHSLEVNKLMTHYDHTVLTDFLKVHGASITPLIGQLRWLLLAWLLFTVFIDGGLLFCATEGSEASAHKFWQGGAAYFFSFLKIGLVFLGLFLGWTALLLLPIAVFLEPALEYFYSEAYPVWGVVVLLMFWMAGLALLFIWHTLSRLHRIKNEGASVFACVRAGWRLFWQKKGRYFALILVFGVVQLAFIVAYLTFEAFTGMTSFGGIVVLFLVQQAFVFFRIVLRSMLYAGVASVNR